MKKTFIIVTVLLLNIPQQAYSQEPVDLFTPNWDYYMYNYDKENFTKPVTPQEFDKAIETLKNQQKNTNKPKKRHWWSRKKEDNSTTKINNEEKSKAPEIPPSSDPLLRLPLDVNYNGTIIKNGFYLVSLVKKSDKSFLLLKQGTKNVIEIEAKEIKNKNIPLKSVASTETINELIIKVIYTGEEGSFESLLPIHDNLIINE